MMPLVLFEQYWLGYTIRVARIMARWSTEIASYSRLLTICHYLLNSTAAFLLIIVTREEWSLEFASLMLHFLRLNSNIWTVNWIAPIILVTGSREVQLLCVALQRILSLVDQLLICWLKCIRPHIAFICLVASMRIIRMRLLRKLQVSWCLMTVPVTSRWLIGGDWLLHIMVL